MPWAVAVRRFSISHQNVDNWIFGSNKTVPAARAEFETQLQGRLTELAKKYELDAAQRRKLQLAGRGDIKRFLGEAEAIHAELGEGHGTTLVTLDQQEYVQIQQRAMALRNRYFTNQRIGSFITTRMMSRHCLDTSSRGRGCRIFRAATAYHPRRLSRI